MSSERIYREPSVFTRSELVAELNSGDPCRIASALASAVRHDDDWQWTQEQCLMLLKASATEVRWAAATCLGDLAFFFNRPIDHSRVLTALYEAAEDPSISDPVLFSISLIKQKFPPS
jgi:uncharacterized protein (DUF2336 family)